MKKVYLTFITVSVALGMILSYSHVNSKITNPPAGSSGDPFTNNSCAQSGCHPSPASTPTANDLSLTIGTSTPTDPLNSSFQYAGSTQYNIGFLINAFTGRYGFQIVALDGSDNQAGSFTVTNAATTKKVTSGGTGTREYMGHLNASATKNWTFKWTSPATSTGDVTFYYSYVNANNDGSPASDAVFKGSVTISPAGASALADINDKISALSIYPNPVNNDFSMSFFNKETESATVRLYSLDGKMNKELLRENLGSGAFSRSFDITEVPAGIYLVKLTIGNASVTRKIVKQ